MNVLNQVEVRIDRFTGRDACLRCALTFALIAALWLWVGQLGIAVIFGIVALLMLIGKGTGGDG